jgi:DNA-binding GntR family transcriptional regulator
MKQLAKVSKGPSLTELAYQSVKRFLLTGGLEEGARLTEESLATQLGISKSPVREALNRLESEGLISIEARRGAYVRTFSSEEARDLYDLREVLEVYAISRLKITPALLRELRASIERTTEHLAHGDKVGHVDEDMHFHGLIAAATDNRELGLLLENLQHKSLLSRSRTYHLSASTAPESHYRIYKALEDGNRELAMQVMREHIAFVREKLMQALREMEERHAAVAV